MTWRPTLLGLFAAASCLAVTPTATTITIDASKTYQTFDGWETEILQTVQDYKPVLPAFTSLLQQAASDLGITRIRLPVTSGVEHPPGYGQQYLDGTINEATLIQQYAYNIINDNANPNSANLAGFEFTLLDWRMDNMVMPFKDRVEARGDKLYLYLSYTDFGKSTFEHADHPDEYAEFMLVLFDHLKAKYGVVPDGIDVMNEPDQTPWTAIEMGDAISATAARLAAAGYHPDFIVASVVDRGKATSFFESVIGAGGSRSFVSDLSYHCYADSGSNSFAQIAAASRKYQVGVVMNECWNSGNNISALMRDLKDAGDTAWQEGPFNGTDGYYLIDKSTMKVSLNGKTRFMRPLFRTIRPGAVRIDATTNDTSFDPVAFVNTDGTWVVAIKAGSGVATIAGLPAGTYDIGYSTESELDGHRPSVTIGAGQSFDVTMPQSGAMTITGKPVNGGGPKVPTVPTGNGRRGSSAPTTGRAVPRPPG